MSAETAPPPPTLGPQVCRWIEANLVLGEGDWFGEPVRLRTFQRRLLYRLYELNADGSRRYRRALIGFPKGNGKTPFASWVASVEMAGPVVFDRWLDDGRPVGKTRSAAVVPVGAASFDQADLVFSEMKNCWAESPRLKGLAEVFDTEILLKGAPGRAYRIAAARATNDGGRPSCFVADELHEWNTPAQEGAHLVMANGTAKRADSLQLAVTTAGCDLETLLGRMYLHGKRVQAGEVVDDGFFFDWCEGPENVDFNDDDALRAAIRVANPAADDFVNVDDVLAQMRNVPEFEARRYFLNQWTRSPESWLPSGAWEACFGQVVFDAERPAFVGVDMALKHDSIAVVLVQPDEAGRLLVDARVWQPDAELGVDVAAVENHLRALHREFNVKEFAYDPAYFERSAQVLWDEGLPMLEFTQSRQLMVPACQETFEAIVNRRIVHNGNPTLTDHVLSAVQRQTDQGWTLSKGRSKRKIDACIGMVIGVARAIAVPEVAAAVRVVSLSAALEADEGVLV